MHCLPHSAVPTIRPWVPPSSPSGQIRLRNDAGCATNQQPPPHIGMVIPATLEKQDASCTNTNNLTLGCDTSPFPQLHQFATCLNSLAIPPPSANSYEARTIASYEKVKRITDHINRDKTTEQSYGRHLRNYDMFWDDDARAAERAALGGEGGRPITAYKVTEFLDEEMNRAKRKRGRNDETAGTGVGKSSLSQSVSALEYYRNRDQHLPEYQKNPESLRKLRDDPRIRTLEKAAKHNEPRRIESSLLLKAAGTSSDTYTVEEMRRMSAWYLRFPKKRQEIAIYTRDRAMTLLPGGLAFRGDSTRAILMSDVFVADIPMPELGIGCVIQALGILADNAKTNQQGRIDEHAALRHRLVDLCPVGALAFHLFAQFHILEKPLPNFAPDFTDPTQGEFGLREWYHHYLFSTKDATIPMSYDNHRERVNHAHLSNDVSITKVTHAGRVYAANTARKHGATADGTKALGGWGTGEAFRQCYDRTHPKDAMIGVAMFDGNNPVTYFVARSSLVVPTDLSKTVFPWIEAEEVALRMREHQNKFARDIALRQFLRTLMWFREVLLQDAAVLFIMYPDAAIWSFPPFNNATFRQFSIDSVNIIKSAEEEAQRQFQNLPEHLISSLRGIVTGISLAHEQQRQELVAQYSDVVNQLSQVLAHLELQGSSSKRYVVSCYDSAN